jgi:hypothetical protein
VPNSANLRPVPFAEGNRLAERHGFYSSVLTPVEDAEVAEIADALRELSPLDSEALEPLVALVAGQLWRRRRAYADLEANGVVRARGKAAPILRDLATLERSILDGLRALSLTPQAAADLGLTLARTAQVQHEFDLEKLDDGERRELERLMAKAEK